MPVGEVIAALSAIPGTFMAWRNEKGAEEQASIRNYIEWCRRRDHRTIVDFLEQHGEQLAGIERELRTLRQSGAGAELDPVTIQRVFAQAVGVQLRTWIDRSPQPQVIRTVIARQWLRYGEDLSWPSRGALFTLRPSGYVGGSSLGHSPLLLPSVAVIGIDCPESFTAGPDNVVVFRTGERCFRLLTYGITRTMDQKAIQAVEVQVDEIRCDPSVR